MGLKIIKSSEPIRVERVNVCLYGAPGIGKSSVAFTADAPLLLDFDGGAHRAANRKDTVRVSAWSEVVEITADDLAPYRTVIIDTAGRALDLLTMDILARNPKAGRGGALSLQGYGQLKAEFVAWLRMINGFGKDVVLIAHMDEQRNGDDIVERLDVQGGSKGEIYKAADAMGRITMRSGQRVLLFDPSDAAFGKNPGQLEPLVIQHPDKDPAFLAGVIQRIKAKLNALTAEQAAAQQQLLSWRERIEQMADADAFNAVMEEIKTAPKAARTLYARAAKAAGLTFDKATAKYVPAAANADAEQVAA